MLRISLTLVLTPRAYLERRARENWIYLMRCPFCQTDNDRVLDSRSSEEGYAIRRRRECMQCKRRYTTYERLEELAIKVVKKDGVREPFSRDKIRHGLARACWKRPLSDAQINKAVAEIESDVYANFESEIETQQLGEMVMEHLGRLDQVAYVRFASVYMNFDDVSEFVNEIESLRAHRELSEAHDDESERRTGAG